MIKGDMPKARVAPITFLSGFIYCFSSRREAREEDRKDNTQMALPACEIIVANAYIPAKYGMDVIDSGVPVLSMHSPWEVTSKADIYEARRGYEAFLRA